MRESRPYGSERGAFSNGRPYRDRHDDHRILIAVIGREIRHLNQALALDADPIEARRDLTACERIRASLLLAMAQFQPRPRRPLGSPRSDLQDVSVEQVEIGDGAWRRLGVPRRRRRCGAQAWARTVRCPPDCRPRSQVEDQAAPSSGQVELVAVLNFTPAFDDDVGVRLEQAGDLLLGGDRLAMRGARAQASRLGALRGPCVSARPWKGP
jgi:hypothetical protein